MPQLTAVEKAEFQFLASKVMNGSLSDADRPRFEELGAKVDEWYAERQDAQFGNPRNDNSGNRSRIGRDGGSLDRGPVNRESFGLAPGGASDIDIALHGWARNGHGLSVAPQAFDAANRLGQDPRAGGFEVNLQACSPRLGRDWHITNTLGTQSGAAGGYLIPEGFMARLEKALKSFGPMFNTSEIMITTDARELPWPVCNDTSNEGSQVGESTDSDFDTALAFGLQMWRAYKFSSDIVKVPFELLRDNAINLGSALGDILGERLGRIVNRRATVGNGAATIKGIVTDAVVGKTAASTTSFTMDEVIDLIHSVESAYRDGAAFMMHDTTMAFVRKLKDGNGRYLWQDSIQLGMPPTLMGYPVHANSCMSETFAASEKLVVFGQLSKYKLRIVGSIRNKVLNERFAEADQVAFLSFLEADGKLLDPSNGGTLCPVKSLQLHS